MKKFGMLLVLLSVCAFTIGCPAEKKKTDGKDGKADTKKVDDKGGDAGKTGDKEKEDGGDKES